MTPTLPKHPSSDRPTVYTTEAGRICAGCGHPVAACTCRQKKSIPSGDGIARVRRELKGRKGKTVTTITGLALDETALRSLLSDLKRLCGTGGTLKDGILELQGDHRDAVFNELKKRSLPVKLAGG